MYQSGPVTECASWWSREPTIPGSAQDFEGLAEMCGQSIPASGGLDLIFRSYLQHLWF